MSSPVKLAHIVLKTSQFTDMVSWWKEFLEGEARHEASFFEPIDGAEAA